MVQADQELGSLLEWPLRTRLELAVHPAAVRAARRHVRHVLHEWGMRASADTVELLVSEIVTNAVRASGALSDRRSGVKDAAAAPVRLWMTSDRSRIMIRVWDADHRPPVPQPAQLDSEGGWGLRLVQALSVEWGYCATDAAGGPGGKVVWAVCARQG
jgi:anti-sigma regulatory factor (Ser/Thr protein kinase)